MRSKNYNWQVVDDLTIPNVKHEELLIIDIPRFKEELKQEIDSNGIIRNTTHLWGDPYTLKNVNTTLDLINDNWPLEIKYGLIIIEEGMDTLCYLHPLSTNDLSILIGLPWCENDSKVLDAWLKDLVTQLPTIVNYADELLPIDVKRCVPKLGSKSVVKCGGIQLRRDR